MVPKMVPMVPMVPLERRKGWAEMNVILAAARGRSAPPPHAVSISRHLGLPFGRVSHKQNNTHTHTHTLTHTHTRTTRAIKKINEATEELI